MLEPLHVVHQRLRHHPRAVPWRVRFSMGLGRGARSREITMLAPATAAAPVLSRVHNGVLLLNPADVAIAAPEHADGLPEALAALQALHSIPIHLGTRPPFNPEERPVDLPATEVPDRPTPVPGTLAVGLDIGGTGLKVCAMRDGRALRHAQAPTWPEGARGVASLIERSRALVLEVAAGERVGSLGVGFASPMGIGGQVVGLSTVMQQRLGGVEALQGFAERVAEGITDGPIAFFNDLANLGLSLSGEGRRRLLRLQIGTSFGGCWIDADGTVNPAELGRLVVDAAPDARPHTYLPLRGAMKSYLSNYGIGLTLNALLDEEVPARDVGFRWATLNRQADPRGPELVDWVVTLLRGVVAEAVAFLPGLHEVELGGAMLQDATGRLIRRALDEPGWPVRVGLSRNPGYDGAVAAARAPLLDTPLRGVRRLGA
ncbi:MAG: ROK family protein [Alphaproteobacteria bacterium]|nr:ROK family protein [Alphaproteobacteria bacterium]